MGNCKALGWYLISPRGISRFLSKVFRDWGYRVFWNQSDSSESFYLKLCLGTKEEPESLHIRISNHSLSQNNSWVMFDVDLYCSYEREGATSYIKLLTKLAGELDKPLPAYLEKVRVGTMPYKRYSIEMQRQRRWARKKGRSFAGNRLYV